jgi:hypothetical protein
MILHAILLWSLVSAHVLGGACLLRWLLPKESPWFGFILPSLAVPLVANFIEHGLALSFLSRLLPFTTVGSVGLMIAARGAWRALWKPTVLFLLAFAFTLTLRYFKPDIGFMRDGPIDLFLISNFCMGGTLPPDSTWMAGFKETSYYDFPHYAASVLTRLLGVDAGTGFNVAGALLNAFIYFCVGSIAWRLSRRRLWVALLTVVMTMTAINGAAPILYLTHSPFGEPDDATNPYMRGDDTDTLPFAFDHYLTRIHGDPDTHELIPLGYSSWVGCYHSVEAGQFLTLFAVYCLVELMRRRRSNLPWVGLAAGPFVMLDSSTWGVPLVGSLFLIGAAWCWRNRVSPRNWRLVVAAAFAVVALLTPQLVDFLQVRTPGASITSAGHIQLNEFVIQWWPLFVPWFALVPFWRRMEPAARVIWFFVPAGFLLMEFIPMGCRLDATGKLWGYLFGAGWAVYISSLLGMRSFFTRGLVAGMVLACAASAGFWYSYYTTHLDVAAIGYLDGRGGMRTDPVKARIFAEVSKLDHVIMMPGKDTWSYADNAMMADLTHNSNYVAWCWHEDLNFNPNSFGEGGRRDAAINALYDGKCADPLGFLQAENISALVIWPDDQITDATLSKLKEQLAVNYVYRDFHSTDPGAPNAGVFVKRSNLSQL